MNVLLILRIFFFINFSECQLKISSVRVIVISEYKCMKYKGKILLKATLKLNGNLADQNLAINLH